MGSTDFIRNGSMIVFIIKILLPVRQYEKYCIVLSGMDKLYQVGRAIIFFQLCIVESAAKVSEPNAGMNDFHQQILHAKLA